MIPRRLPRWLLVAATLPLLGGSPAADPPCPNRSGAELQTWVEAHTRIPLGSVIAVGDDALVAFAPAEADPDAEAAPDGAAYSRVLVQQEALDPTFAARTGARSSLSLVDIDCAGNRARELWRRGFEGADLSGAERDQPRPADWRSPTSEPLLNAVSRSLCDPAFQRPGARLAQRRAPSVEPLPAGDGRDAQARLDARQPGPAPIAVADPAVGPAPPPAAERSPPAAVMAFLPRPHTLEARSTRGGWRVQIGAFDSELQARQAIHRALSTLAAPAGDGFSEVRRVSRAGRAFYRGLVGGFASQPEAAEFCAAYRKAGRDCLIRKVGGEARTG